MAKKFHDMIVKILENAIIADTLKCCSCDEIIGYYDRNNCKHYDADQKLNENLEYEIIGNDNFQFIKPEKEAIKYLCHNCYESMAYSSKIKICHKGKMEDIGYFDPRSNIIFTVEYLSDNTMIEQELIDQIKKAIINDKTDSSIIELKEINDLLNHYSYDSDIRNKINGQLKEHMKDKSVILLNLQDSIGFLSCNEYFLLKQKND